MNGKLSEACVSNKGVLKQTFAPSFVGKRQILVKIRGGLGEARQCLRSDLRSFSLVVNDH